MNSSTTEQLVDVTMPQMGVSVVEGMIVAWRKRVGDAIEADEPICDVVTDKVDTEVPAPISGIVREILVEIDQTVDVGTVIARIGTEDLLQPGLAPAAAASAMPDAPSERAAASAAAGAAAANGDERSSPVVRRLASEHGIDLAAIPGTGRDGRITREDVLRRVEGKDEGSD